jgi:ribonuclease-3
MLSPFVTMAPVSSADHSPSPFKYRFNDADLLDEALTHKSYVNERRSSGRRHNERLEFLGDAVLSLIVSDYLATRYPELSEGALSKLKAKLVSLTSAHGCRSGEAKSYRRGGRKRRCWQMDWRL